jgi:hypothetical protein
MIQRKRGIGVKSQARLIGGLGPHQFPGDKKFRAHKTLKMAPALRSPSFSLPFTAFGKSNHSRNDAQTRADRRIEVMMEVARMNAGASCGCKTVMEAGLPCLRPCRNHEKVMRFR